MKTRLLFFVLSFFAAVKLYAQSQRELVFFNEEGRHFTVSLNGTVQNPTPETHVRITDLPGSHYKVKIVFEDGKTPSLKASVQVAYGYEKVYKIGKTKNKYGIFFVESSKLYDESVYSYKGMWDEQQDVPEHLPMSQQEFQKAKKTILAQSFKSDKMLVLKQIVTSNSLYTSQVIELVEIFSFDDEKLEVAKLAYPYVYDAGNYYMLNDIFSFSKTKEALADFMAAYDKK